MGVSGLKQIVCMRLLLFFHYNVSIIMGITNAFQFCESHKECSGIIFLCCRLGSLSGSTLLAQAGAKAIGLCKRRTTWGGRPELANQWVRLEIVPQLGGRRMQVTFGGHDYLFVNQQLKREWIPLKRAGQHWNNYGGDKIWPMPEGEQDEQHGRAQAENPWTIRPFRSGGVAGRTMHCAVDWPGGSSHRPAVCPRHQHNRRLARHPLPRRDEERDGIPADVVGAIGVGINAAAPDDPNQFNPKFWGLLGRTRPARLKSYQVVSGMAQNPSYSVGGGLFRLHWVILAEKSGWTRPPAGWRSGWCHRIHHGRAPRHQPTAQYPGKATMLSIPPVRAPTMPLRLRMPGRRSITWRRK